MRPLRADCQNKAKAPVGPTPSITERVIGFEPTTYSLGSYRSTAELHPHLLRYYSETDAGFQVLHGQENALSAAEEEAKLRPDPAEGQPLSNRESAQAPA